MVQEGREGPVWEAVREFPWKFAHRQHESIVQIIDEFQYLNSMIYWDAAKTNLADNFASAYMSTAEYKMPRCWFPAVGWDGSLAC